MLKQYAAQVEKLRDQIKSVEGGNILRERDLAARRADEAERKGKQVSHFPHIPCRFQSKRNSPAQSMFVF